VVIRSQAVQANPIMDMNTTPLIDVLLVLLVMFIITIPIQSHAVKLDLPAPGPVPTVQPTTNEIQITGAGATLWNGTIVTRQELTRALRASQQVQPTPELHLRADATARYQTVDEVLATIKREHVRKFGFVGNENYMNVF